MHNRGFATDYVHRATVRLDAIDVLYRAESWADVAGESQEAVELVLKGLLRSRGIDPPRIHDVREQDTGRRWLTVHNRGFATRPPRDVAGESVLCGAAASTRRVSTTSPLREQERLPEPVREHVDRLAAISRDLRRDRELAFYGAEDLVPSEFYAEKDARRAFDGARFVVETAASVVACFKLNPPHDEVPASATGCRKRTLRIQPSWRRSVMTERRDSLLMGWPMRGRGRARCRG